MTRYQKRPPKPKNATAVIVVRCGWDLRGSVEECCKRTDMTLAEYVRHALRLLNLQTYDTKRGVSKK